MAAAPSIRLTRPAWAAWADSAAVAAWAAVAVWSVAVAWVAVVAAAGSSSLALTLAT
jgi:hypothetical protein